MEDNNRRENKNGNLISVTDEVPEKGLPRKRIYKQNEYYIGETILIKNE